jgi:hypothetical protein
LRISDGAVVHGAFILASNRRQPNNAMMRELFRSGAGCIEASWANN